MINIFYNQILNSNISIYVYDYEANLFNNNRRVSNSLLV